MAGPNTLEFSDATFDEQVLQSKEPVLVDFWAEWCAPCKALGPVIDELAKEYAGRARIGKIDTDANREVSTRFAISSIPSVLLFHNGQMVEKFIGLRGKREFQMALDRLAAAK